MDNAEFDTIGRSLDKTTRSALEQNAANNPPSQTASTSMKLPERQLHPLVTKYTQIDKSWYLNDSVVGFPASHENEKSYERGALHHLDGFYVRSLADKHAERTAKMTEEEKNKLYGSETADESTSETDKTPTKPKDADRIVYTAPDSILPPLPGPGYSSLADVIRVQDPTAPPTSQDVYVSAYLSDIWKQNREREAMLDRARAHGKACSEQWVHGLTELGEEVVRRQEARMSTAPRLDFAMTTPQRRERVGELVHSMQNGSQSAASQRVGAQPSEYAGNAGVRVVADEGLAQAAFADLNRGVGAFTSSGMPAARPVTSGQLGRAGVAPAAAPVDAAARYQTLELWSASMQRGKAGAVLTAQAWPQVAADKAAFAAAVKTQQARAAAAAKPASRRKQRPRATAPVDATLTSGRAASTADLGRAPAAITKQPPPPAAALLAAAPAAKPGLPPAPGAPAALPTALDVVRAQALSQVHQSLHRRLVAELNAAAAAEREQRLLREEQDDDEEDDNDVPPPAQPLVGDLSAAVEAMDVAAYTLSPLRPLAAATTLSRRLPRASLSSHDASTGSVVRAPYDYDDALTATAREAVAPAAAGPGRSAIRRVGSGRLPAAGLTSAAFAAQRAAQRQREIDEERRRVAEDPNALAEFEANQAKNAPAPADAPSPAPVSPDADSQPLTLPADQLEALVATIAIQPPGAAPPAPRPAEPVYAPLALSTKTFVLDKAPPPKPPADPADKRPRPAPKRPVNDGPRAGRRAAAPAAPPLAHTFGAVVYSEPLRPVLTTPAATYQVAAPPAKSRDKATVGVGAHRTPVTVLNQAGLAAPQPEAQQRLAAAAAHRMERDEGLKAVEALRATLAQNRVVVNHKALEQALVPPPNVLSAEDRACFAPQMSELVEDIFTAAAKGKGKRKKVKAKQ